MPAPDLIEILQQRLQTSLSDSQQEALAELIAGEPTIYDAALAEILAQEIEVIPVSLEEEDHIDVLVVWLTQLAATSNVGRGFNAIVGTIALILLLVAIGIGVKFFYSPSTKEGLRTAEINSTDITTDAETISPADTDKPPAEELIVDPEASSAEAGSAGLVLPDLPLTPGWLSFDDPAGRLDHSWVKSISRYIRQPLEKPGTLKPVEQEGVTEYFDLEGDFLLPAPRNDGSSLRIRLSDIQNMSITAENDTQQVELTYNGHFNLKRYRNLPISEFVRALATDSEPRFRRHFVESRIDPQINFNWALTSPIVNDRAIDPDYFAIQWKGFIIIPADGRYHFHVVADDGIRLRLNGIQIMDSWGVQPETEVSGAIDLTAGTFPLELDFFSDRMHARISLAWESEDIPRQLVPSGSLRSSAEPDALPGLTGHYCYGPFIESVEVPAERAVDLVDNDNGRWYALMRSGFDLRFQDGHFIVARGDIPLTSLPMAAPPAVLKIKTQARLRYLEPLRLESLQGLDIKQVNLHQSLPASSLPWYVLTDMPDTRGVYEIGALGDVRLTRTEGSHPVHLQANIPVRGSTDLYALMNNPTHLTGIRFQHPQNDTFYALYFLKMGDSYVISMNPTDLAFTSTQYRAGLRFTDKVWWRAHYGESQFVISMSPDGEHWNAIHTLPLDVALPRKQEIIFGLTTIAGEEHPTVSIDRVLIESDQLIEQLSSFLPVGNVPNISPLKKATRVTQSITEFLAELESQRPDTISPEQWHLACYARALQTNTTPTMRQEALLRLLHYAILYHPDTARVYEALVKLPQRLHIQRADATLHSWVNVHHLYDMLAGRLWVEKKPQKLEQLINDWFLLPGGAGGQERYSMPVAPELLTRLYLYHLRNQRRWQELYGFATKIQYLSLSEHGKQLFDKEFSAWRTARWLHGESANFLEQEPVIKPTDLTRFQAERPPSVQTDRETVNSMLELFQAVETGDLDSAMKMIANNPIPDGLFPVDHFGIHYQSGMVYLRSTFDQYTKFADKIGRENAGLADLRLKKALASGNMNAVSGVALRFPGTVASRQALELLADQQLSAGLFLPAAQRYIDLLEQFPEENPGEWQAKRYLALALVGQKPAAGVEADVELDGGNIPKDEFNALLDQLVTQRGRQYIKPSKPNLSSKSRTVVSLADMSLPGSVRSDSRRTRQVSFLDLGNNLLVNQPARLTCFTPGSKQIVWKIEDGGQGMPEEYTYSGQPILFNNGVFTSVFKNKEFHWTLINPADGKPIWESPATGTPFADPLVAGSSIYVLAVTQQKTTFGLLSLQQLDATSGEMLSNTPLINVQIQPELFRSARSTIALDRIIFTLEGVVYCINLQGKLLWARLFDQVPKLADQHLHDQVIATAPLVVGDKILVHTAGSPGLLCLDRLTGALLWRHDQPDIQKLVGTYGNHVLLACQTGIQSLQLERAEVAWFLPITANPHSVQIHNDHVLVLMLDKPLSGSPVSLKPPRALLWIHLRTGNVEHNFSLKEEGVAFVDAEQIFTFADQVVAVSNVNLSSRTFKLVGLPVK